MKRPIRKRSFLLLEIIASLFLITLCLTPLIQSHLSIRTHRTRQLKQMEQAIDFQNAFCAIKERLYRGEHSWQELVSGTTHAQTDDGRFDYTITQLKNCNKKAPAGKGLLVAIDISSSKLTQRHTLFIQGDLK